MPPSDLVIEVLLRIVLPTFAVAAGVLIAILWLAARTKHTDERIGVFGSALAFILAVAAGNWTATAPILPMVPSEAAWEWLPWTVLAVVVSEVLIRLLRMPAWLGWPIRLVIAGSTAAVLVPAELRPTAPWLLAAFALVVLAEWAILVSLANRVPGGSVPLSLALVCLGGTVVLVHAHSARLADIATLLHSRT